jgi:hypothetical protein
MLSTVDYSLASDVSEQSIGPIVKDQAVNEGREHLGTQ